jgi:hypothetical protein
MDVDFNARYSRWRSVPPDSLFGAELEISLEAQKGHDIEKNLLSVSRGATALLLWTDCDREGEALRHLKGFFVCLFVCLFPGMNGWLGAAAYWGYAKLQLYGSCRVGVDP